MADAGLGNAYKDRRLTNPRGYNTDYVVSNKVKNNYAWLTNSGTYTGPYVFRASNDSVHVLFLDGHGSSQPEQSNLNRPVGVTWANSPRSDPDKFGPYRN